MADVKLMVLYPFPSDVEQFENDYREHIVLLHKKMNIPADAHPYTITKMHSDPENQTLYYQMFTLPFPTAEALRQTLNSPEMQEIAGDAARISSGGTPIMLIGSDAD